MRSTGIERRTLLGLLAGGLAWPLLPLRVQAGPDPRLYLSARAERDGGFWMSGFTPNGRPHFDLPLPARGHAFAVHPAGTAAVLFARRPGTFARVVDLARGAVTREIHTPSGRHFYGHGVFGPGGRLLYATENDFEGERGVIGVYDAADGYRRVGELPSHGIGPHEVRLLSDGETLMVANGGILTRPDLPRVKLNLPTMAPSLVYLDRRDGRRLEARRLAPELHQLSIRHLAVGPGDTVALAMQYEGPAGDLVPLVGVHRRGARVRLFDAPPDVLRAMRHYCGSIAFDTGGRVLAVSSPRGHVVTLWDGARGNHLASVPVPDGSGVAPAPEPGRFLASSGQGGVVLIDARAGSARPLPGAFLRGGKWDNHMVLVRRRQAGPAFANEGALQSSNG